MKADYANPYQWYILQLADIPVNTVNPPHARSSSGFHAREYPRKRTRLSRINDEAVLKVERSPTISVITHSSYFQPPTNTDKSVLYTTMSYSTNVLDFIPGFQCLNTEVNPPYYGVELEVACNQTEKKLIEAVDDLFS